MVLNEKGFKRQDFSCFTKLIADSTLRAESPLIFQGKPFLFPICLGRSKETLLAGYADRRRGMNVNQLASRIKRVYSY